MNAAEFCQIVTLNKLLLCGALNQSCFMLPTQNKKDLIQPAITSHQVQPIFLSILYVLTLAGFHF